VPTLPKLRLGGGVGAEDTVGGDTDDRLPERDVGASAALLDLRMRRARRRGRNCADEASDGHDHHLSRKKRLPRPLTGNNRGRLVRIGVDERIQRDAEPARDDRWRIPYLRRILH
jgi:hypothetical protein